MLVVPADHPAKTVKELVAWAKANPDKSNYGTSSPAFTHHHRAVQAQDRHAGAAIPYKGTNEFNACVVSEQCPLTIFDPPPAIPLVQGRQDARRWR